MVSLVVALILVERNNISAFDLNRVCVRVSQKRWHGFAIIVVASLNLLCDSCLLSEGTHERESGNPYFSLKNSTYEIN